MEKLIATVLERIEWSLLDDEEEGFIVDALNDAYRMGYDDAREECDDKLQRLPRRQD